MVQLHALERGLQQFGAAIELEAAPPKKMAKLAIITVIKSKRIMPSRSVRPLGRSSWFNRNVKPLQVWGLRKACKITAPASSRQDIAGAQFEDTT